MDDDHRAGDGDGGSPDYTAFISYSHRNAEDAKRLHRRLERYRVPRRIQRSFGASSTLRPIFLDRADYRSAGSYTEETELTLRRCGALIVLCTPDSARSVPVNEEIITFKWLGRAESVLPIIVAGEPNATDRGRADEECFPPALRYAQDAEGRLLEQRINPIAADARPGGDGPRDAFLKIVAGVLKVPFDELKRRHVQATRWRRAHLGLLGVAVLLAAGGGVAINAAVQDRGASLRAARLAAGNGQFDSAGRLALAALGPRGALLGWPPAGVDTVLLEAGIRASAQLPGGGCAPEEVSPDQPCFAGRIRTSADGNVIAASISPSVVQVASVDAGAPLREIVLPGAQIQSVGLSADGAVVALGEADGSLRVERTADGTFLGQQRQAAGIDGISFAADGGLLIVLADGTAKRVRATGGGIDEEVSVPLPAAQSAVPDPSGRWVLARAGRTTSLVGPIGPGATPDLQALPISGRVSRSSFSADGSLVALVVNDAFGDRFYVVRTETAEQVAVVRGHHTILRSIGFSSDGKHLITGGDDRKLRIWPLGQKEPSAILEVPVDIVAWAGFSPDGSTVAAFSEREEGTPELYAWRLAEPIRRLALRGHTGPIRQAFFTATGKLVTAADDASVRIWDLPAGFSLLDQVRAAPRTALAALCEETDGPLASFAAAAGDEQDVCNPSLLARLGLR